MKITLYLLLFCLFYTAQAQTVSLTGVVSDRTTRQPVVNANITLTRSTTHTQFRTHVEANGKFTINALAPDAYTIRVVCVGYTDLEKKLTLRNANERVDTLFMQQKPVELSGVEVVSVLAPVEVKKDTIQFNAGAFKSNPDASAEDLLKKMPGITIDNTAVKAQGENVQQVLVDGRQFFGDDPFIAMRNIPADVIEKVQVYDKLSDQAELTGFDDGQAIKTINIITRPDRRNGQFGKLYGGAGEDQRYQAGGNTNFFSGSRRFSIIGLSNNINQQNFSAQDILGALGNSQRSRGGMGGGGMVGGGRGMGGGRIGGGGGGGGFGGGGFGGGMGGAGGGQMNNYFVGTQNGINTTHSLGLNYTDTWADKVQVTASYFGNFGGNDNTQFLDRSYIASAANGQQYHENDAIDTQNQNHRLNMRVEYTIDSSNALILAPRMSFQTTNSDTRVGGITSFPGTGTFSQLSTDNSTRSFGNSFAGNLVFRHRFAERGRTLSLGVTSSSNTKHATAGMTSIIDYTKQETADDTLDQQTISTVPGYSVNSNIAYTEPVTDNSMLLANYSISYTHNNTDKRLSMFDAATNAFDLLDTALSNTLENRYTTYRYGVGYMARSADFNINLQLAIQKSDLGAAYSFPADRSIDRSFENFVPTAMFQYRMSQTSNLRFMYRASTTPPSVTQMQSTVDNSNPALPTAGNPDLKQSYTHSFTARYSYGGFRSANSLFALLSASFTNGYIGDATFLFQRDTTLFGTPLIQGTQLTQPVNFNGYQSLNSLVTYGWPIEFIKSSVNLSTGLTYSRTPGMVNSMVNITRNTGVTEGAVLASNISQDVDFTLSYNYAYNKATTSAPPQVTTTYSQQTANLKSTVNVWNGFILRNDLNYLVNTGSGSGYDQHLVLWNLGFAKKFLADNSLEAALNVSDVLNQNSKISRSVTETYIEDTHPEVLHRYIIFVLTYTFKNNPF